MYHYFIAEMNDERPKVKRDAQLKAVFFPKKDRFHSDISLHFCVLIVCYGFSVFLSLLPI